MSELELKMSSAVDTSNVSWIKRKHQDDPPQEFQIVVKKPRYYYYRLASESSNASEEDTESVYSFQEHETDIARDTSDTDSKSEDEKDTEFEYEVASLSGDSLCLGSSASDIDDQVIFAEAIGALCDSPIETWITDVEESDSSSFENTNINRFGFVTCVQCKSINENPLYRYCEKCFQNRKKFYPPRPRGNKKREEKKMNNPVKLDTLRSCLSGLSSLDSGVGSSQECPPLDLDQIVVPDKHLKSGTSISDVGDILQKENAAEEHGRDLKRKRQESESSLSDFDIKKRKVSSPSSRHSRPSSRNSTKDKNIELETSETSATLSQFSTDICTTSQSSNISTLTTNFSSQSCNSKTSESNLLLSQSSDIVSKSSNSKTSESDLLLSQSSDIVSKSSNSKTSESDLLLSQSSVIVRDVNSRGSENTETSDLCIICNNAPKDGVFVHTNMVHQCCCYKCAKRTLYIIKRCPICNRPVNKVLKLFKA